MNVDQNDSSSTRQNPLIAIRQESPKLARVAFEYLSLAKKEA